MRSAEPHDALLLPHRERPAPTSRSSSTGLPADFLSQAAERLSTVALVYAFVFFMAGFFPPLLFDRAALFSSVLFWLPGVLAIGIALLVAFIARSGRLDLASVMTLGLWFEVVSSYGIAAAEFLDPVRLTEHQTFLGLSWVAVWVLCFTVVVPTRPRRAIATALAAVSSVPVIIAIGMATIAPTLRPHPLEFFLWFIFPYLLVILMAFVGARVVYGARHRGDARTRAWQLSGSSNGSGRAGWAKCGARSTACWHGRRRSS